MKNIKKQFEIMHERIDELITMIDELEQKVEGLEDEIQKGFNIQSDRIHRAQNKQGAKN